MFNLILEYCDRIKNGRTEKDILKHLDGEQEELDVEALKAYWNKEPGEDGVLGEAIDVFLCAVDYAHKKDPSITAEQIEAIVKRKLDKWERVYGSN